jgi:hypothetical protein
LQGLDAIRNLGAEPNQQWKVILIAERGRSAYEFMQEVHGGKRAHSTNYPDSAFRPTFTKPGHRRVNSLTAGDYSTKRLGARVAREKDSSVQESK